MNRRSALAGVSLLAVAACSGLTASQLDTDADALANAISTMAIALEQVVPAADTTLLHQVESLATTAGQDAAALNGLIPTSTSTTATYVQAIVSAVTTYDPLIIQFFPSSAPIIATLNAALVIGAALLQQIGVTPVTPAASARMHAAIGVMSLSEARAYLGHLHARTKDHR